MPESAHPARPHPEGGAAGTASDEAAAELPPCMAALDVTPDGERMRVALRGELDLGARRLLPELHSALTASGTGIDLFLDAVGFCDCSGLGVLLDLRTRALGQGKAVTVRSCGTAVGRLLGLTGTRELFEAAESRPGQAGGPASAAASAA